MYNTIEEIESDGYTIERDSASFHVEKVGPVNHYTTDIKYGNMVIVSATRNESEEDADKQAIMHLNDKCGGTIDWK